MHATRHADIGQHAGAVATGRRTPFSRFNSIYFLRVLQLALKGNALAEAHTHFSIP